jgi:hypothetical protein
VKISLAIFVCAILCVAAGGQTDQSSGAKAVKGSGCIEKAVETSCHVLTDSKTGDTYNLLFSGKVPKVGTAIRFSGTEHPGMTTCMQGKPVNVTKWKKESGIQCPPAVNGQATH